MIDKLLSVKLAGGLMAAFMAMHILIMSQSDDPEFFMIMFLLLALLAGSTLTMDDASARKALLAFGVGWMPAVLLFTYGWVSGTDTDELPPIPGMVMWGAFVSQSLLVGLSVGVAPEDA